MNSDIGNRCAYCDDPCNENSQVCGRCMRNGAFFSNSSTLDSSTSSSSFSQQVGSALPLPNISTNSLDEVLPSSQHYGLLNNDSQLSSIVGVSSSVGNYIPYIDDYNPSMDNYNYEVPVPKEDLTDVPVSSVELCCIVCHQHQIVTVNLPCCHAIFCYNCSRKFVSTGGITCSICRGLLTEIKPLYLSCTPKEKPRKKARPNKTT